MVVVTDRDTDHQWLLTDAFYLSRNSMFYGYPLDHDPVRDLLGGREA